MPTMRSALLRRLLRNEVLALSEIAEAMRPHLTGAARNLRAPRARDDAIMAAFGSEALTGDLGQGLRMLAELIAEQPHIEQLAEDIIGLVRRVPDPRQATLGAGSWIIEAANPSASALAADVTSLGGYRRPSYLGMVALAKGVPGFFAGRLAMPKAVGMHDPDLHEAIDPVAGGVLAKQALGEGLRFALRFSHERGASWSL